MKQKRLALAIATVLGSFPLVTSAQVNLDTGSNVTVWATELDKDDSAFVLPDDGTGATNAFGVVTKIGFGFPSNTTRYLRLDLNNNADFISEPTCSLASATALCTKRTGGSGESFVTFSLQDSAAQVVADDIVEITLTGTTSSGAVTPGVRVASNSDVQLTYSLHNNDVSVDKTNQANADGILYDSSLAGFISFQPVLSVQGSAQPTLEAEVATGFTKFSDDTDTGIIGRFLFGSSGSSPLIVDSLSTGIPLTNKIATVSDVVESAVLTVTGNFTATQDVSGVTPLGTYTSAASKVFLDTNLDCNGTGSAITQATAVTGESATFTLSSADEYVICFKANGVSVIEPTTFNLNVDFTAKEGYSVEPYSFESIGEITQNGTVLDTPYITRTSGYISRVMFTNTGNKDAEYQAVFVTDAGATATAGTGSTGIIPAGSNLQVNAADLVDFSAKSRGAIRFTISAPIEDIQGIYQTVNLNTGDAQSVVMIRKGGG